MLFSAGRKILHHCCCFAMLVLFQVLNRRQETWCCGCGYGPWPLEITANTKEMSSRCYSRRWRRTVSWWWLHACWCKGRWLCAPAAACSRCREDDAAKRGSFHRCRQEKLRDAVARLLFAQSATVTWRKLLDDYNWSWWYRWLQAKKNGEVGGWGAGTVAKKIGLGFFCVLCSLWFSGNVLP